MALERQPEWEELEEEEQAWRKGTGNQERKWRVQMAVTVEIPRERAIGLRLVTMDEEDRDLRMREPKGTTETISLEASQHAIRNSSDHSHPH